MLKLLDIIMILLMYIIITIWLIQGTINTLGLIALGFGLLSMIVTIISKRLK